MDHGKPNTPDDSVLRKSTTLMLEAVLGFASLSYQSEDLATSMNARLMGLFLGYVLFGNLLLSAELPHFVGTSHVSVSPLDAADRLFKTRYHEITPQGLADELIGYLNQIDRRVWTHSDARFQGQGILLALVESPLVSDEDHATLSGMSKEAYLIDVDPQRIRLVGNSVLALQHAMFDLLERAGCRFLSPADAWTIIPKQTGLKLQPAKVFEQPDYISRQAFFTGGGAEGWSNDGSLKSIGEACRQWDRATRQGAYSDLSFGHTWGSIIRRNRDVFEAHPEYFRMNESGDRESFENHPRGTDPPPEAMHFCVSNPELMELCVHDRFDLLTQMRKQSPTLNLISMDPNDGHKPCHCEKCKALGNASDRVYTLANYVARELRKLDPDSLVGVMIYTPFDLPPENTKVESNIVTLMALAFNRSGLSYDQLARGWKAAGATKMLVYPYYGIVQWTNAMPAASPSFERIARDIPFFHKQWNVVATLQETGSTWGRMAPAMYLARKLLWDVDADATAIYEAYFREAFGDGADEMRALYDLWDTPHGAKLNDTNIAEWLRLADQAFDATADESPAVKRRVEDILAYLHYVTLFHQVNQLRGNGDEASMLKAMQRLFSFNWRIRHRQVVQTWGSMYFLFQWLDPHFKESWRSPSFYNSPGYEKSSPWMIQAQKEGRAVWQQNEQDVTSSEIRRLFREDLENFSKRVAQNRSFSNDLVPLLEGPAVIPTYHPPNCGLLRTIGRWYFYLDQPTKLQIRFKTFLHPTEKDKPDHVHEAHVFDSAGSVIFSKEPEPYAGGNGRASISQIDLQLDAGVYRLEARGGANSPCRPVFQPAVKYCHEQSSQVSTPTHYYTPGYFYVPKDTKELRLNNNGYLTVKAPSWDKGKAFDVKTAAGLNIIPVPAGDDGQIWELRHVSTGEYQLLNVPPYISSVPANLLVPREVFDVDGRPDSE